MTGKTKHKNNEKDLSLGVSLPPNLQRYWEELQRKYYSEKYALIDLVFFKTLTYICEDNERGALGFVINRPTDLTLIDLFKQLGIHQQDVQENNTLVLFNFRDCSKVSCISGLPVHKRTLDNIQ